MVSGKFRLLVGLGNPGSKYAGTRHNVGFLALEKFAAKNQVIFSQAKKLQGQIAAIGTDSNCVRILLPTTYMNDSGKSIRATLNWFDLREDQLLVLADDMDLPLGRIRLRTQGSSGGHNGIRSIIQHLGTQNFCRIKIGIGPPSTCQDERKEMTIPHVLGKFSSQELPIVDDVMDEVVAGLDLIQRLGVERAGTQLNSYKPKKHK